MLLHGTDSFKFFAVFYFIKILHFYPLPSRRKLGYLQLFIITNNAARTFMHTPLCTHASFSRFLIGRTAGSQRMCIFTLIRYEAHILTRFCQIFLKGLTSVFSHYMYMKFCLVSPHPHSIQNDNF